MRYIQLASLLFILLFNNLGFAKPIKVKVVLDKIEVVKTSEASGDEVYFSITIFSNKNPAREARVPDYPLHWLSKNLSMLKPIVLWQQDLQEEEAINVIISLIEHDVPPWNVDDHLGSVKATLIHAPNRFLAEWSQPDFVDQPEVTKLQSGESPRYVLKGQGSEYYLTFRVVR